MRLYLLSACYSTGQQFNFLSLSFSIGELTFVFYGLQLCPPLACHLILVAALFQPLSLSLSLSQSQSRLPVDLARLSTHKHKCRVPDAVVGAFSLVINRLLRSIRADTFAPRRQNRPFQEGALLIPCELHHSNVHLANATLPLSLFSNDQPSISTSS